MTQPSVRAMLANSFGSQQGQSGSKAEQREDGEKGGLRSAFQQERSPPASPCKSRSLSDSTPKLSPSPKIVSKRESKDDTTIANPRTPRRPDFLTRGLSLQMPARDTSLALQTPVAFQSTRVPLSPQLDARDTYGTPATVLPRHSRGLDFARACTNLHHSTLAEQSSPDSSPTITQKGMMIPQRRNNITSMSLDSPYTAESRWLAMGHQDKSVASSSVGSINMLGSDSSSSGSDDDDPMDPDDNDDPMVMTPQVLKLDKHAGNIFGPPHAASPGGIWSGGFSPSGPNFLQIQRNRLRKARSRKSSSSASGHSSLASPGPGSPPAGKAFDAVNGGYFAREVVMRKAGSRRESLSMVANDLHISSGNDSGDEAGMPAPTTPGVVRRPVTRRGNLLPKSRQFGRIRAELLEESAPVDSEVKREAEIIRQVRESDTVDSKPDGSTTANSSPSLLPTVPGLNELEDIPEDAGMDVESAAVTNGKGLFGTFNLQPWRNGERNSWSNAEGRMHTPPPPPFFLRASSSAVSDDISMDSPATSMAQYSHRMSTSEPPKEQSMSRGSTPQPMVPPTAADGLKKKRRRDDDFDVNSIKRRAVSPGLSVQNSPVLSQSPQQRDPAIWGPQKTSREGSTNGGHAAGERSNSGGSTMSVTPSLGPKRVGLQKMTDTNDGLMKMSIE